MQLVFGGVYRPYDQYNVKEGVDYGPIRASNEDLAIIVIVLIVIVAVASMLQFSLIGKAMRAVSDNPDLAASSGIDVERVILFVWALGGGLAALGGVLFGVQQQVHFEMGFRLLLLMFAGITLGGLGTAYGALVGSVVVGLFIELSTIWSSPPSSRPSAPCSSSSSCSSSVRRASWDEPSGSDRRHRGLEPHPQRVAHHRGRSVGGRVLHGRHGPEPALRLHGPRQLRPGRASWRSAPTRWRWASTPTGCRSGCACSSCSFTASMLALILGVPDPAAARRLPRHRHHRGRRDHPPGAPGRPLPGHHRRSGRHPGLRRRLLRPQPARPGHVRARHPGHLDRHRVQRLADVGAARRVDARGAHRACSSTSSCAARGAGC